MGFVRDRMVLLTGAGGGIGRDSALALAREGAKVVVNDIGAPIRGEGRDPSRAEPVVEEVTAAVGTAISNCDGVAEWDGASRMVTRAVQTRPSRCEPTKTAWPRPPRSQSTSMREPHERFPAL